MNQKSTDNHWHQHSLQWDKLGSPLRPCIDDLTLYKQFITDKQHLLILGVTPELAELSESAICVDSCRERINLLWNTKESARRAVQADWLHLPFNENQFDTVIGDGCFTQLVYPEQYITLLQNVSSQLKTNGTLVTRVFINTETCDTAEVCELATKGLIGSFHAFKWRFVMALLNERKQTNIPVVDIVNSFNHFFPDRENLSKMANWDIDAINTIDVYQNSSSRYSYPTLSQLNNVIPETFKQEAIKHGTYELAESCPIIVWKKIHE